MGCSNSTISHRAAQVGSLRDTNQENSNQNRLPYIQLKSPISKNTPSDSRTLEEEGGRTVDPNSDGEVIARSANIVRHRKLRVIHRYESPICRNRKRVDQSRTGNSFSVLSARRLRNQPSPFLQSTTVNDTDSSTIGSDFKIRRMKEPLTLQRTPIHRIQNQVQQGPRSSSVPRGLLYETREEYSNSPQLLQAEDTSVTGRSDSEQSVHTPRVFRVKSKVSKASQLPPRSGNFSNFATFHQIMRRMDEQDKIRAHRRYQQKNQRSRVSNRFPGQLAPPPPIFFSSACITSRIVNSSKGSSQQSIRFNFLVSKSKDMGKKNRSNRLISKGHQLKMDDDGTRERIKIRVKGGKDIKK